VSGDSYGLLLGYLVLDLLRGREGVVLGGRPHGHIRQSLAHFYLQAFPYFNPYFNDWGMRLFAGPRAFSDPT
jgi:hypothetical protein